MPTTCGTCNGQGFVQTGTTDSGHPIYEACGTCNGEGVV